MKLEATKDQELLQKLIQGGRTNLSKWFEKIPGEFCQEQAIEERVSVESIEKRKKCGKHLLPKGSGSTS